MALQHEARAERLRELRKAKGNPSRPVVASAIGSSPRTVESWEMAEAKPNFESLEALARYYSTTVEFIEDGTIPETPPVESATQLDRIEAKLDRIIAALGLDHETAEPQLRVPPGPPSKPRAARPKRSAPGQSQI